MSSPVDLHSHTTCSDGLMSPADLVEAACRAGLRALAITDHDTLDAFDQLGDVGDVGGLRLIRGLEFSCFHDGHEIHVLGYFVDSADEALRSLLDRQIIARRERIARIFARLESQGVVLPQEAKDRVLALTQPGRPHVARLLVEHGHVANFRQAFHRWLATGAAAYERRSDLPAATEVVTIVAACGGATAWAHPGTDCLVDARPLTELQDRGLAGIEAYHPGQTSGVQNRLAEFAKRRGLVATGGSDFHGDGREGAALGHCGVDLAALEKLEACRGRGR